jgi:hypothetical protein
VVTTNSGRAGLQLTARGRAATRWPAEPTPAAGPGVDEALYVLDEPSIGL